MLEYLKSHIQEEIDGAVDYMTKAVEHKGTACGETFYQLAQVELTHANTLYSMFSKQTRGADIPEKTYSDMLKAILDKYMVGMSKVEALKKLYYTK